MKISLEWLRDYVDFPEGPERLEQILTDVGFPVEEVRAVGDDWMLDVEVTSNRPDCLGHIGIAREVAAVTGAKLRIPDVSFSETDKDVQSMTSVQNDAPDLCRRYTARVIEKVQVGPSPDWMRQRLETIGQRSISNVVDITNYVLIEIGQPLHTFDMDKLGEQRIIVRRAQNGEQMETIDHSRIELNGEMLVIADAAVPVALAGVMGGADSEVTEATKNILLESAWFDPLSIRKTSRLLTLGSESSYRFERNVSEEQVEWASRRATALLVELAGGKAAHGVVDSRPNPSQPHQQTLRLSRLNKLVGIEIHSTQAASILQRLGFDPQPVDEDTFACTVPAWRGDIVQEADLIEEVIRIHGYDKIPTAGDIRITVRHDDAFQSTRRQVMNRLAGCGYFETISVGFIEDKYQALFAPEGFSPVRAIHQSRDANTLRHSLLPSLLNVRKLNQDAGNTPCRLFELAVVHQPSGGDGLPTETLLLSLITDDDLRNLRGALDCVFGGLDRRARLDWQPADLPWARPQTGATLLWNGREIGFTGIVSDAICQTYDLEQAPVAAELHFDALIEIARQAQCTMDPLPRFPGITRDLSLVMKDRICWADIETAIREQPISELQEVAFVGVYHGKGIPAGHKSLTLSMLFRRDDTTLTHEQADAWQNQILTALRDRFDAELRA